jgi:hypothetical protein
MMLFVLAAVSRPEQAREYNRATDDQCNRDQHWQPAETPSRRSSSSPCRFIMARAPFLSIGADFATSVQRRRN